MSRCCAKPTHAATAQLSSTSGVAVATQLASGSFLFGRVFLARRGATSLENALVLSDEADDVLGLVHGFCGDRLRTLGAVDQDTVDVTRIGDQPLHLGSDRREFGDAKFHQRVLEAGELSAAEFLQNVGLAAL